MGAHSFLYSAAQGAGEGLKRHLALLRDADLVRQAQEKASRDSQLPDPAPEPAACELHDWRPAKLVPGQPRPPASFCPECQAETEPARTQEERDSILKPKEYVSGPQPTSAMDLAYGRWLDRQDEAILFRPGSFAARVARESRRRYGVSPSMEKIEEEVLAYMDNARAESLAKERNRSGRGRVLSGRIENGEWVEFRALTVKGSRRKWHERVVRVVP